MTTWSLPSANPSQDDMPLSWLFQHWSAAKAWNWLRSGRLDINDSTVLARLARYALKDLGISHLNLSNAWNQHLGEMVQPWLISPVRLPATSKDTWPAEAQVLAETSLGLLSVLVANGWNAFEPFLPMPDSGKDLDNPGETLRPAWGVEVVMGMIGKTRLDDHWRLSLVDQMMRSSHCPSVEVLQDRQVCKTKKGGPPVSWFVAALKYRLPLVARVCVEHDIHGGVWNEWPERMPEPDRAWWSACLLENTVAPARNDAAPSRPRL